MSVKIRFMRVGRKNLPYFRLAVSDTRFPRDGKSIEVLGHYSPLVRDEAKKFTIAEERVKYWLSVGAKPSPTVTAFLKEKGFAFRVKPKRDRSGRKKARAARMKRLAAARKAAAKKK